MKRVLIIAYYFPPLGLAGVNRPLQLYKHLQEFGWEPHILTVKPVAYAAYEPELLDGLDTTRIHRSDDYWLRRVMYPAARVLPLAAWREKIRNSESGKSLFSFLNTGKSDEPFPDSLFQWKPHAVRLGRELMRQYQFDLILSTSPPVTTHLIAKELHDEFNLPWVADFRDYWGPKPIAMQFSDETLRSQADELIRTISNRATARVAINHRIAQAIRASTIIPNAYDVAFASGWNVPTSQSDPFRIGLLGNMTPLSWMPLINMLKAFRRSFPSLKIEVIHVGDDLKKAGAAAFASAGLDIHLQSLGRKSRAESVGILNATLCFYIGFESGVGDHLLPTRLFDMLGSGRPILAGSGASSELRDIVQRLSFVSWYDVDHPETGARYLSELIKAHGAHKDQREPFSKRRGDSEQFSSRVMASKFATLFNEVIEKPRIT